MYSHSTPVSASSAPVSQSVKPQPSSLQPNSLSPFSITGFTSTSSAVQRVEPGASQSQVGALTAAQSSSGGWASRNAPLSMQLEFREAMSNYRFRLVGPITSGPPHAPTFDFGVVDAAGDYVHITSASTVSNARNQAMAWISHAEATIRETSRRLLTSKTEQVRETLQSVASITPEQLEARVSELIDQGSCPGIILDELSTVYPKKDVRQAVLNVLDKIERADADHELASALEKFRLRTGGDSSARRK